MGGTAKGVTKPALGCHETGGGVMPRPRVSEEPLTPAERKRRQRSAEAAEKAVANQQGAGNEPGGAVDVEATPINPREAARQIQHAEDTAHALRYGRSDMDAAFEAGAMFAAAQQALGGAGHLRGVVDEWVGSGPPLLWLFQSALSGSPWAEEAEAAGWLGESPT